MIHQIYPTSNDGDFIRHCDGRAVDLNVVDKEGYTIYKNQTTCKRCLRKKKPNVTLKQTRFKWN